MTENELIAKIKELQQIKPRKDWVVLVKNRILEQEKPVSAPCFIDGLRLVFQHRYAFATLVILIVLIGTFGFAQKSLPGDTLFPLKKISERGQTVFVSAKGEPKRNLELANKRLDDLAEIAQTNSVKNLDPAIKEYQASISEAAKSLAELKTEGVKEIISEVKKLEEKREKVKALGIEIGENQELDNVLGQIVEREIKDLEKQTLTEEQEQGLAEVKADFEQEDYSQALEKILFLTQ